MKLSPSELQVITDLWESNLNLQAFKAAENFGPLKRWEGTDALLIASHLSHSLGAPEQSFWLASRAWHRDKTHPQATFYYGGELLGRRGPLPALQFLRRYPDFDAEPKILGWWYSLHGQLHSSLRDFATAERYHARAEEVSPEDPWTWVARSYSLEQQDRYNEALDVAYRGLELGPHRRASVAAVAHLLTLLERDDEALELLQSAVEKVENAWLLKQLSELQSELGMYREAYDTLTKSFDLLPLKEEKVREWLFGGLSDLAHVIGNREEAIELAEKASGEFYKKIAENLKAAADGSKRVQLTVGFLRQHHVTCAPATISNLARYWKKEADHLQIVEQICYDGTPSYKERIWAESNGWKTREFTLNWDDARVLLDAGVPLTLATVYPGGGHLQAIIGYDEARGTYLIRDPYYRRTSEFLAAELVEEQAANGPRVMAMAPRGWNDELLDSDQSESNIYDLVFAVESALDKHERAEAEKPLAELDRQFSDHRLRYVASWSVAGYDSNTPALRAAMQGLLKKFPDEVNLRLSDLSISADLTGRSERLRKLEDYSTAEKSDPLIWQMFGFELGADAKQHKRALKWLYRSLRRSPGNGLTIRFIADILWAQRKFDDATNLYRLASSLSDKDEHFAYSYFLAMRFVKREDEAITVLRERAEKFAAQSGMPVRSLFSALREVGRVPEAFEALDRGMNTRPADGELKLFAAEMKARYGQFDAAESLIEEARPISSASQVLRASALVRQIKGDLPAALDDWRKISAVDPLAIDAHESIAFLTKGLYGEAAAKEYLRKACRKFPTNRSLQTLRLQYLNEEPTEAIAVIRDMLRRDPDDIWGLRELSHWFIQVGRVEEALQAAERAVVADPHDPVSHFFRGRALEILKRYAEAGESYRNAIGFNADHTISISSWLGILRSVESKRDALKFIFSQLNSQVTSGEGLLAYRDEARRVLDRVTLLGQLREFAKVNRRSWFAASALIQQLAEMGKADEALAEATDATERFPLSRQVWLDLALVHKLAGRPDDAIEALRKVVSVDPVWSYGIQELAEAYQVAGRFAESRDVLLEALSRLPFDNYLLGYLADAYWNLGDKDLAIETAKKAVSIEPDYQWAWSAIKRWADQLGKHDLPVELARELTVKKPKDIRAWNILAEMLDNGIFSEDRMTALAKALEIDPYNPNALAMKANALTDGRMFEEAIAITKTVSPDGHRPEQLRYVEAGIEMMRGRPTRCVEILVELTESSPGYLAGWSRLADLYRNDPNYAQEYRKVAMEMVRLAPREPIAFGYLAESCLRLELGDEAKEALRQAVILDPNYQFAVDQLFDMMIEENDITGARELVETVVVSAPANGLPIAVELAVKRKDRAETCEAVKRLLGNSDVDRNRLVRVFERVGELFDKKDRSLLETLDSVVHRESVHPLAGRFLIDASHRLEKIKGAGKRLDALEVDPHIWAQAATRYIELLAEEKPVSLAKFIDRNAEKLRNDTESWAAVGYQLSNLSDLRRAEDWYEGWQRRPGVMPWMLWNYSIILRRNGHSEAADSINSAALTLQPDDTVNLHLTSIGLTEFARRNFDAAGSIVSQINTGNMSTWDRFLFDVLNDAVLAIDRIEQQDRGSAQSLIESIAAAIRTYDPKGADRMVKGLARGALNVLLEQFGSKWLSLKIKGKLMYHRLG